VIRYRVSTNPEDVSAWGAEQTLAVTGDEATYPTPIFLASENGGNGRLYLFYRGANRSLCYQYSDDIYGSGVTSPTFAGDIEMVTGGAQGVYFQVGTNFTDRIDFGLTNAIDGSANHNDVRHCIFKAEELFRSDGTTSLGS